MARFSLLPRDRTFFDLFIEAGQNAVRAAKLLDEMMHTWPEGERRSVQEELRERHAARAAEHLAAAAS